jgi:hypothetical protein
MSEIVFGNVIDTDGIVFDICYAYREKEQFIKATLLLPIACERQYPESRECEILQYLEHFGNHHIIEAVWRKLSGGHNRTLPADIVVVEAIIRGGEKNINNIYCPRISRELGENVVILACEMSDSPNRDGLEITQTYPQQNAQVYFSKEPGFGGSVVELRFEEPVSDEDKMVLLAIVLTPTQDFQKGAQMMWLGQKAVKRALWAGFRANWKEYYSLFTRVPPSMLQQIDPNFETLEICEYPFHIAGKSTNKLIILEWHCELVCSYQHVDD